jgi:glycosyltransferase involved in cell wall biosynthesis
MILHIETLKSWGGEQNKLLNELIILKEIGCKTILICNPNSEISKRAKEKNIRVIELEMNKKNYLKTIPYVKKILEKEKIKLAISHASTDSWILAIAGNLARNKPLLFRERHNLFPVKNWLSRIQHKKLFDGIFYISDAVKDYMLSIGVSESKLHKLFDAVDVEHFIKTKATIKEKFNIPRNDIVIGTFTSLTKSKGVYEFAEVSKNLLKEKSNLTIVFGGNYTQDVKNEIDKIFLEEKIDISKVIWTGFQKDAATIIKDFDIFLFLSHSEGLGTVILEAMASSLPIIVYDKRPMNDLVINNKNGFCIEYLNIKQLLQKTKELIDNKSLREKFGKESLKIVKNEYDYPILKKSLKELLEKYEICK